MKTLLIVMSLIMVSTFTIASDTAATHGKAKAAHANMKSKAKAAHGQAKSDTEEVTTEMSAEGEEMAEHAADEMENTEMPKTAPVKKAMNKATKKKNH